MRKQKRFKAHTCIRCDRSYAEGCDIVCKYSKKIIMTVKEAKEYTCNLYK